MRDAMEPGNKSKSRRTKVPTKRRRTAPVPSSSQSPKKGAPTLYDPPYHCGAVIEAMSIGMGKAEAAVYIGISPRTLQKWEGRHPEFKEAVEEGVSLALAWWERQGRVNLCNKDFNSTLFMMNMSNRFGWSRKVEGSMSMSQTVHEIKEVRIESKPSQLQQVAHILREIGALPEPEKVLDSEVVEVCPTQSDC